MSTTIAPTCWLSAILEDLRDEADRLSEEDYVRTDAWVTNAAAWLAMIPDEEQRLGWLAILADHFAVRLHAPLAGIANLLQQRMIGTIVSFFHDGGHRTNLSQS